MDFLATRARLLLVLLYVVEAKGDDFEDDVNEDFFPVRILVDRCRFLFLHCFVVL